MSQIRFSPESWSRGAQEFETAAHGFAGSATSVMESVTDLGRLGCNQGGTIADVALSMVFPALFNAVQETVQGLVNGLNAEAANMELTAALYRHVEERNAHIAASIGGN